MPPAPPVCPASHAEIVAVLADAIRMSAGGGMTRRGEAFLAGLAAEHLADRLALAGFTIMRPAARSEGACQQGACQQGARQQGLWDTC